MSAIAVKELSAADILSAAIVCLCLAGSAPLVGGQGRKFGTLADFVLVDDGLYMGDFRSGHPHGHGTLLYFTDDSKGRYNYTGNFVRGQRSGQGTTAFRDNRVYTGSYEKNKENGRGKISYFNGDTFDGFFVDGKREGSGMLALEAGGRREGEWSNDRLNGFVFFHWNSTSGATIERWQNGRRKPDGAKERDRSIRRPNQQDEEGQNTIEVTSDGTKKHPSDFSRDAKSRELNMSFSEQNNHRSSISRKKAHGKTSAEQDENEEGEELDLGFLGREARKLGQLILKSIFDTVNLENGDEDND